ncbi:Yip1 family protein [Ruminiclostridium herbifermentans]|nr:Yip1 family protein [Ruminiclostridium herbifermentans]
MNDNNVIMNESNFGENQVDYSKMSFIKRVIGVICFPGKVMQSLEQKPRVLFGILLTALVPLVMILSTLPMYMEYTRGVLESTYAKMNIEITEQQLEQTLSISQYSSIIGGPIGAVIMLLIYALVIWSIIKIFKGEGKFKQVLSVIGYATVISALSTIVTIITTRLTGVFSDVSFTSIASLIPEMKGSFIYGMSKMIEVFTIWQYAVIAIGITTVSKLSKKKVYIIVACIFALLAVYSGITEVTAMS